MEILRLYSNNGKENGNYTDYIGVIQGLQDLYWGYIGIMEKKMETTIACWGYIRFILGLYGDNGNARKRWSGSFPFSWSTQFAPQCS